ncbi:MAG: hypothetical protein AB7U24_05890 [Sulfurimonadaceae bacterium]
MMRILKQKNVMILLLGYAVLQAAPWSQNDFQTAKNEASQLNSTFKSSFSNATALEQRVANPMTTSANLTTLDGSKSGSANILCSGNANPYASLHYVTNSNVDFTLYVSLDTNGDGNFNLNRSFSGISGIHTYGVFSCSAGSYTNCRYYKFALQSNNLILSEILPEDAGGAYCTNRACQSIANTNYIEIIETIGSALSAELQTHSSRYITVNTNYGAQNKLLLYGQDFSNCEGGGYDITRGIPNSSELQSSGMAARSNSDAYATVMQADNNEMSLNTISNSDKSDILQVSANSSSTASIGADGKTVEYTNSYKDENGNWVTISDSSFINADLPAKPESCMVEWSEAESHMTTDEIARGNTGSTTGGPSVQIHSEIRECTGQNYTVCPHVSPERVRYPCGSLDQSLGEAASGLQVANELSKDFICSQ